MRGVLTVTMNPSVDESTTVDHVVPEDKLRCDEPRFDPGGGGINVARAMLRLGTSAFPVFPSGGLTGRLLEGLLDREGVPHQGVPIDGETRVNLHVDEVGTGRQFRFNMPGPDLPAQVWRDVADRMIEQFAGRRYVVVSGSLPRGAGADLYAIMVQAARHAGAQVVLDAGGPSLAAALQCGVQVAKLNLLELSQLVGSELGCLDCRIEAARSLVRAGQCEVALLTMAAEGAAAVSATDVAHVVPPPVKSISKIGAGDSSVAGFVTRWSTGASLRDSVRYAVAAGTAAVMGEGTQLCRKADVDALYAAL